MLSIKLIKAALAKPGKTKGGLAAAMKVRNGAVSELLAGTRLIKADEVPLIVDYLELNAVPLMGRIGAGAVIEPEYEQVPPEGLASIDLPFQIPDEMVAFEVSGESMLPKYEDGDVIVTWKEQRHPISAFYGEEAAVMTKDGRRYLKTIERGKSQSVVDLVSFNAKRIESVKLTWVGEVYITLRRGQLRRMRHQEAARARKAAKAHEAAGTQELPLKRGAQK